MSVAISPQMYTQDHHTMAVTTPLGKDKLLLINFAGEEGLSRIFRFELLLLAANGTQISFDKLLGQSISIRLNQANGQPVHFNGICSRLSQGERDTNFTSYRMEIVPRFWLLTHKAQSRIFQQLSVPDILKKVFAGLDFAFEIEGNFEKRDYCVQYRETDFDFASRLMEEEGIFYYFRHTADGHKLVLANTLQAHPDLPIASELIYDTIEGGDRPEDRIFAWEKTQELRSGKVTLWDHTFELPHRHLDASRPIKESVSVGSVTHSMKLGANNGLELYDYPGEYAQRFDGIDPGGGERPDDLQKIYQDNVRTAGIRMEQEAVPGLIVNGESKCRQLISGYRFKLTRHFDANGDYVLTSVTHKASQDGFRTDQDGEGFSYSNTFTCIPFDLPFRPQQQTTKPTIKGTQTAVVVGPPGEEIWPDKYSRVKVQFHWDREGKHDPGSSCWVRVATPWAGKQWGMIHIPRIGQEVVVAFEEGDPDRPIIVGSVYNFDQMPPFPLPAQKTQSGIKSNTHKGGGYNELVFDDTAGKEQIRMHGQYNMDTVVNNNQTQAVGVNRKAKVGVDETTEVGNNQTNSVGVNRSSTVGSNDSLHVGDNQTVSIGANQSTNVAANQQTIVGANIVINAGTSITLKCGAATIHMNQAGYIQISGTVITVAGAVNCSMTAPVTNVTGAVLLTALGGITEVAGVKLAQVRGGKVDILASGELIAKGATIKLN